MMDFKVASITKTRNDLINGQLGKMIEAYQEIQQIENGIADNF